MLWMAVANTIHTSHEIKKTANTRRGVNSLTLDELRRRLTNVKPTFIQHIVSAGKDIL